MPMIRYSPAWYIHPSNPSSPLYPHYVTHHHHVSDVCSTVVYSYQQTHFTIEHFLISILVAVIIGVLIVLLVKRRVEREMRESEEKAEKEGYNIIWK